MGGKDAEIKALSIRQPWASLIVAGIKPIENRTWYSNYRGPLLIHAAKKWDKEGAIYLVMHADISPYLMQRADECRGMIIGRVKMVDCATHHPSKWFFGPYGFVFEDPQKLLLPIPYRGQLGLFEVPDSFIAERINP